MTAPQILARIDQLAHALRQLTEQQLRLIESVVTQFRRPFITINRHCDSDIVDTRSHHRPVWQQWRGTSRTA